VATNKTIKNKKTIKTDCWEVRGIMREVDVGRKKERGNTSQLC